MSENFNDINFQKITLDWKYVYGELTKNKGLEPTLMLDIFMSLIYKFVNKIHFEDFDKFLDVKDKPILYLGNHQNIIESILFMVIARSLSKIPMKAISKIELSQGEFGNLLNKTSEEFKERAPFEILFFDRKNMFQLLKIMDKISQDIKKNPFSILVHVEGSRALRSGQKVTKVSQVLMDLALKNKITIVPIRFSGGLPKEPVIERITFPYRYTSQNYYIGNPIFYEELERLTLIQRRDKIIQAINDLGPPYEDEIPNTPDLEFEKKVQGESFNKILIECLKCFPNPCLESKNFLNGRTEGNEYL